MARDGRKLDRELNQKVVYFLDSLFGSVCSQGQFPPEAV